MTTLDQTFNKIKQNISKMNEWYDRKTIDFLLMRDWFIDEEGIEEALDCADHDAWEWVYANRTKYSTRIRTVIEPDDYRFPVEKLALRVVELTDSMMEKLEADRKKKVDEAFEKDWIEHSKTIQDRGFNDEDSNLDDAWDAFCLAKDRLTKYLEKPVTKKYVAPTSRGKETIDPKQAELEDVIRRMENEYDLAQKAVDEVDTFYWNTKKDEYRKTWMPTV